MAQTFSPEQKLTPMMEQYRSLKRTLSDDTVLFFRLGDFYEMFFEDAVRASEILNITLTGRDAGPAGRVPMCGIPCHAFGQYVRVLLDKNLKVAICEQVSDPQLSKGLVERKVTRIITPATYLDEEGKKPDAEYMAAVVAAGPQAALAALDLGTGDFSVREVPKERLIHELAILNPRELILPKGLKEDPSFHGFLAGVKGAAVTVYENWVFGPAEAARLLKESFSLASERGISFHDHPLAVSAAGAVVYYLKDHLHCALGHIRFPVFSQSDEFMVLDRQALKNLEIVSHSSGESRTGSLLGCIDRTVTPMGARVLYRWLTHPLLSVPEIQYRQEGTAELAADAAALQNFREALQGIRDVERIMSRLNYGVANARDLLQLNFFLGRLPEIRAALFRSKSRILQDLAGEMTDFPHVTGLIGRAIIEAPPLGLRDGGFIRDGYSPELDDLRRIASKGKSWLVEFQQKEIQRTGIKSLRIRYSQVFGYAIEVSTPNLHLVPPDYVRRQTLANAERFVTPELKEWDEKISGAQERMKALEFEIFQEIRQKILQELEPLQKAVGAVGILDGLLSLGTTALQKGWVRPQLTDSKVLKIRGGRHPVVEAMLPAGQFVENDAELDENQRMVILTGPNMAGKSTYIRQVAQIVLLAQVGSFVPAQSAIIGLVDRIFTRIGASDDLARGESTFMVEMIEMAHILQAATGRSLLILDEVGRGTSTFDGVSLAWAICEHLLQGPDGPRTLFATHYHELIQLESEFQAVQNYTMTVRETPEGIVFLRKVARGGSDRSYGIHVARLAGIPPEVTRRAARILEVLENENTQAVRIIEAKQNQTPSAVRTHPVLEEIRNLDVEGLTPLEALNRLAGLKRRLQEER
ncbi:MAG: DNA mismatch repair protein MutS [Candidatus Omnitrophica bacterium]|nr:DNA mismatch repair protein MutS [Candidatus Omnitrophota bacterium]